MKYRRLTPLLFKCNQMGFLFVTSVIGLSAWLCVPANGGDCDVDFGDRFYEWAERDARRQSVELAEADFANRLCAARVLEHKAWEARMQEVTNALNTLADGIPELEKYRVSLPDPKAAVKLQRASAMRNDQLFRQRAEIDSLRQRLDALITPPSLLQFQADGLNHVGRATLLASFLDLSNKAADSLNGRYEIYVDVTFDSSGAIKDASGTLGGPQELKALDSTAIALLHYGEAYSKIFAAAYLGIRFLIWSNQVAECEKRINQQKMRTTDAVELLATVLPSQTDIFDIYARHQKAEQARFAPLYAENKKLIATIEERWRNLMTLNLACSDVTSKILTAVKVEALRRAYERDPLGDVFNNLALAQMTDHVGKLLQYNVNLEMSIMSSCRNVEGIRTAEDLVDARSEASAQLELLRQLNSFAPLHDWLSKVQSRLKQPVPTADRLLAAGDDLGCTPLQITMSENGWSFLVAQENAQRERVSTEKNRPEAIEAKTIQSILGQTNTSTYSVNGPFFCWEERDGNIYDCDDGTGFDKDYPSGTGHDKDYPSGTGSPYQNVTTSANDGGLVRDARRMGGTVLEARANIEERISGLRKRQAAIEPVLAKWIEENSESIAAANQSAVARGNDEMHQRETIFEDFRPLLAETAQRLTQFLREPTDPSILKDLFKETGTIDFQLPDLPDDSVMPDGPSIPGFSQRDRVYPPSASTNDRKIQRESRKKAELHEPKAVSRHDQLLSVAKKFAASGGPISGVLVDALLNDAASLRYFERGALAQASITTVSDTGALGRTLLSGQDIPTDSLLAHVEQFESDLRTVQQQQVLAQGALSSGAVDLIPRTGALALSMDLSSQAERIFFNGDLLDGDALLQTATIVANLVTGWTPGVSWGRDIVEAITGRDLITGEELDEFGRVVAIIGAISGGISSQGIKSIETISRAAKRANPRMVQLIERWGTKVGELVERVGEKVKTINAKTIGFGGHAWENMDDRRVTERIVREVIEVGQPYLDLSPTLEKYANNTGLIYVAKPSKVGLQLEKKVLLGVVVETKTVENEIKTVEFIEKETLEALEQIPLDTPQKTKRYHILPRKGEM